MHVTFGRLAARLLPPDADLAAVRALRHLAFGGREGLKPDPFDATCRHLVLWEEEAPVAAVRLQVFPAGADLRQSYAAAYYDLTPLRLGRALELGRFCLQPERRDPSILRLGFALLARLAGEEEVDTLFGCTSLPGAGTDHGAALAALRLHVASPAPGRKAPATLPLPEGPGDPGALPALLRFYLSLGASVSDHAVIDPELDTLHVLTLLPRAKVPPARLRALQAAFPG